METRSTISAPPIKCKKKIWAIHTPKELSFRSLRKSLIILGVANEASHMSKKDRFPSRKYIGEECKWGVRNYSDHNNEVTQHSDHIDPREKYKEKMLEMLWSAESIQHKFWHQGIILQFHYLKFQILFWIYIKKRDGYERTCQLSGTWKWSTKFYQNIILICKT